MLPCVPGEGYGGFLRKGMKINLSKLRAEEEEIPSIDSEHHISPGRDPVLLLLLGTETLCFRSQRSPGRVSKTPKQRGRDRVRVFCVEEI